MSRESNQTGHIRPDETVQTGAVESDESLVRACLAGRPTAFDELVRRYQDRVFQLVCRMSGSTEEAEDLAQESFLKAFRALRSFQHGARFYTWLFRIALNTCYSHSRQQSRRRQREGARLEVQAADGNWQIREAGVALHADPAVEFERQIARENVRAALEQMDADQRAVLLLRDMEGLDYDAIAQTLGLSPAAVKSRLHRARQQLARKLKDLCPVGLSSRRQRGPA